MGGDRPYQIALVGLGARGYKTWFECLRESSSVTISAVCDTSSARLDYFTSHHPNVPAYASLELLLQAHKPDFAIVSVPNRFHFQCVAQLSTAGVPALKEKPVAESAAVFQQLCRLPTRIGVAFQRRWQQRYVHFQNFLPMIGKPLSMRASLTGKYDPPHDGWRVVDNVGTFQDLGIHMLDIIVWLFGRPSCVLGHRVNDGPSHHRDRESHVALRWGLSGLVGHLYVSEVSTCKEESLLVRGVSGSLHLNGDEITHFDSRGRKTFQMVIDSRKQDAIEAICSQFGDYISGVSQTFSTSIEQIGDTLAASGAIDSSFISNKLVPVIVPSVELIETQRPIVELANNLGNDRTNGKTNGHQPYVEDGLNMAQKRFILNTGDKMPGLGFGTRKPKQPRQTYLAVSAALAAGYRHIDTAFRYNNEDQVGEAVRDSGIPRKAIWITTKIDNSWHHRVAESVELSLAALGLEYIDLLLMHWPSPISPDDSTIALPNWDFTKTWQDMQLVLEAGRVRNIGVSNFGIRNLTALLENPRCNIVPAVNQIELHPCCPSSGLVEFCRTLGIHCTAYSPLAFGLAQLHDSGALTNLSKNKDKSPQQVLIMWGLQRGTSVIPKSVTPERIVANFDLEGWSLTPEEHQTLSSVEERCRVYPDDWLPTQVFWEEDN